MLKRNSLQYRLSLGLTLLFCLFLILASVSTAWVMRHEMNELLDSSIAETAQRILPLAVVEIINRDPADIESGDVSKSIMSLAEHDEHLTYLIINARNDILLKSHNARAEHFDLQHQQGFTSSQSHRIYVTSAVSGSYRILVAESLSHRQQALLEALVAILWPMVVLVPLCFLGLWFFIRHQLSHIIDYRNAVMTRNSQHLDTIDIAGLPDELMHISDSVNHLIESLRDALSAQRSFTANSAHELRTPIATALAQLQHLKFNLSKADDIARAEELERTIKAQARLSEKLMQLAKAEGGSLKASVPVDVRPVLEMLVREYQQSSQIDLRLHVPETDQLLLAIDVDAFAILLRNLLENAIHYGEPEAGIDISFSAQGELSVINDCEALPSSLLESLHERFVRASEGGSGQGLGLAIVHAITKACGAHMQLFSPAQNPHFAGSQRGFEVRIQFSLFSAFS
jgi:two-component system OmpR family sensor kinase